MRGATGARTASGLCPGSTLLPEYHPTPGAREERDGDGNGNSNPILDRGSCSRSAAHPDCNCGKDVSSACEAAAIGKDLRWDDGRESAGDGGGSRGAATSEGMAGEKLFFSTPEIMKVPKEEETTIESGDAGGQESTLTKLKRRIRLKLLAEEARNSLVLTKADAQEYDVSVGREKLRAEDGPSSSSVRSENRNPCPVHHPHQQQQLSQQASAQSLQGKNGLRERVENGRTIVDLSSDDEVDVSNLSRIQPQNNHRIQRTAPSRIQRQNNLHIQKTAQAPAGAAAAIRPKHEEEVYDSVLEKVLEPLLAKVAAAAVEQSTRAVQKKKKISGGRNRSKPVSKKSQVGEPRLSAAELLDHYRNSVSAAAAACRRKRARAPSNNMTDSTPTKGERLKGSNTTTGSAKSESRPARGKGGSRSSKTAAVSNSYEEARENNILRNKLFLQGLRLGTALETRKFKQTPQPNTNETATLALPPPEIDNFCSDRDEDVDVKPNIVDINAEHHVESQRSQVTSASALSGSSSAFQRLDKTPASTDDDLYDPEDELESNDEDELEDNSSESSEQPSMRMRGRLKPLRKEQQKGSRGRPKKASATAPDQELIRILAEVLTSKTLGSLPPNLLQRLENTTSTGGEGEQTGTSQRRRPAASRKKPTEVRQRLKRKAESKPQQQQGSGSQTTSRSERTAKKQSKDTWLAAIPFETPKTEYELRRDEAIQNRKVELDKLLVVSELMDKLKSEQAPRQVRPYHKRWTNEPNPEFNRQTRLRDRLSAKNEPVPTVKLEIVAVEDIHTLEVRPNPFADSMVAKFSNWAALQKHCGPAATTRANSREWDLNEPSMSTGSERVVSFQAPQEGRDQLADPFLTRICTMDVGVIRGQHNGLLAAGGPHGRIAVFALRGSEPWSSGATTKLGRFSDDDDGEVPSKAPLLAWSVDSSWISQVVFLPSQFKEKEMLLLSSSNDGRVVLWDVNQVRMQKGTRELSQEGMPRVVCQTTTLHSGSIFGMHEMNGRMATASEDGVGISVIRETMIFMERCITGHHSDVIRHIRFRDKNVLADCGADMVIGILDVRCPEPCTLKLATAHKTAMSTVEWSPGSESVLLSASLDPQIYLHDIRNPRKSPFRHMLDGHAYPRRLKCFSVYRPTFIDGGHGVATPGEGTHQLSLYAVDTGSAIGKVDLSFDTTTLQWNGVVPSAGGGLWAGGRNGITHCKPIWRLPSNTNGNTPFYDCHELQPCLEYYGHCRESVAGDPTNPDSKDFII